jgi:hypothetical protein
MWQAMLKLPPVQHCLGNASSMAVLLKQCLEVFCVVWWVHRRTAGFLSTG